VRARIAFAVVVTMLVLGVMGASPASAVSLSLPVVVSTNPVNWTPNVLDGQVRAVARVGSKMVVGGTFTQVQPSSGGSAVTRNYLFAFDATTGAIDNTFVPMLDGMVWALEPAADGHSVYVGGTFNNVNGSSATKLVELDTTNGQRVAAFKATADSAVRALVLRAGKLYLGGSFGKVHGQVRQGLAAVDAITGALDPNVSIAFTTPRKGTMFIIAMDVSPDASKLVAIGNFTVVGGQSRWQAAMIDLSTTPASVANWQTNKFNNNFVPACSSSFDTYLRDTEFSPDGSYFVIVTTGAFSGGAGSGTLCDSASRWETSATGTGIVPSWVDYTGGDTYWSVSVAGTAIYVGGHERWANNPFAGDSAGPGAVARPGIAALDPRNGLPFSWNPTRDRGVGAFALVPTPDGLWVGSDTLHIGNEYHPRIAMLPVAGGVAPPDDSPGTIPGTFEIAPLSGTTLGTQSYDGSTFGAPGSRSTTMDWTHVRSAMLLRGNLYTAQDDGTLSVRSFDPSTGTAGTPAGVSLLNLNSRGLSTDLANMTGMFFDSAMGRWYYTVANDSNLYYRYFEPESGIVGAERFVASTDTRWRSVAGMTLAAGNLYFATADGRLWQMSWSGGPTGTPTQISGSGVDASNWQSHGLFLSTAPPPDVTPPTAPGQPTGTSHSDSTIDLHWSAATDDRATTLSYSVYRDGGATAIGTVVSSAATVTFGDTGLPASSAHTYTVTASDGTNTGAASATSPALSTRSAGTEFADGFDDGLGAWTSATRVTIDAGQGSPAPAAVATASAQTANLAKDLAGPVSSACLSEDVNLAALPGASLDLMRMRTAANGPISKVYVASNGRLWVRSDVSGTQAQASATGKLVAGTWQNIELCGSVGGASSWTLYLNGAAVVTAWTADTGTTPIGRIQVGTASSATFTADFDDVVLDGAPG
jgi:Domain of unknown function (DUF5122) beta-propeller